MRKKSVKTKPKKEEIQMGKKRRGGREKPETTLSTQKEKIRKRKELVSGRRIRKDGRKVKVLRGALVGQTLLIASL